MSTAVLTTQAASDTPASTATDAAAMAQTHWIVDTRTGLRMAVPPSLRSYSAYVLLEQQSSPEPELSLLPRLLAGGVHALDIGARCGLLTLEMARSSESGRVWALEPGRVQGEALQRSVILNGLQDRVTVLPWALAAGPSMVAFDVHSIADRRQRSAAGRLRHNDSQAETVQVQALDPVWAGLGVEQHIGFVRLNAEGDELQVVQGARGFLQQHAPIVMFAFNTAAEPDWPLLSAFSDLGYGLFLWSPDLELLLPFDASTVEPSTPCNLLAMRAEQQAYWADKGLLVTAQALAEEDLPEIARDGDDAETARLLVELAAADELPSELTAAQRVLLMLEARHLLLQITAQQSDLPSWVLLVHCLQALGAPASGLKAAGQLLAWTTPADWEADREGGWPTHCQPPLRSQAARCRSTAMGPWLRQMLAEYVALHASATSYAEVPTPHRWRLLLDHPDHDVEVERRFLLSHAVSDRLASLEDLQRLSKLPELEPGKDLNATLWLGLLQSMQAMAHGMLAVLPQATAPAAGAAGNDVAAVVDESPADVLQDLPVGDVAVVDVGASEVTCSRTPYRGLVQSGRATVTGFEPDAAALAQLLQLHAGDARYRFLPHVVGDGQPAVFRETQWSPTGSLLEPHRAVLDRYQRLGELTVLKARHAVSTVRLDEVVAPGAMDLLKVDVQGAELMVFDGAVARLDECLMVWTEVEFVPLYEGQPLFADVDARLRSHGLQFYSCCGIAQRPLVSWPVAAPLPPRQQQIWTDALYVPTAERIQALSAEAAGRLALLAHHVADGWDLCHAALLRVDAQLGSHFAARYLRAVVRVARA